MVENRSCRRAQVMYFVDVSGLLSLYRTVRSRDAPIVSNSFPAPLPCSFFLFLACFFSLCCIIPASTFLLLIFFFLRHLYMHPYTPLLERCALTDNGLFADPIYLPFVIYILLPCLYLLIAFSTLQLIFIPEYIYICPQYFLSLCPWFVIISAALLPQRGMRLCHCRL